MTIIGGVPESKEIGLPISLNGTFENTEIDSETGFLRLKVIDVDESGANVYADYGYWISDVINLGDKFSDFDKVFTTEVQNGSSTFAVQTRVSDNGYDWSDWVAIAMDGTIQSDTKQYIQVRIILYAGFVTDIFIINKDEYVENNVYIVTEIIDGGYYAVPKLTNNSSTSEGFPFAIGIYNNDYPIWRAFDKSASAYLCNTASVSNGYVGYYFKRERIITKYQITAITSSGINVACTPKDFFLEASNDTTTGKDGTWVILDEQTNQTGWVKGEVREFELFNLNSYKAYRIRWISNNGTTNYTGLGELDFYEEKKTHLKLKRNYEFDMTLDTTWSEEGSLHRQKITRDEWLRIDKMNVLPK